MILFCLWSQYYYMYILFTDGWCHCPHVCMEDTEAHFFLSEIEFGTLISSSLAQILSWHHRFSMPVTLKSMSWTRFLCEWLPWLLCLCPKRSFLTITKIFLLQNLGCHKDYWFSGRNHCTVSCWITPYSPRGKITGKTRSLFRIGGNYSPGITGKTRVLFCHVGVCITQIEVQCISSAPECTLPCTSMMCFS